MRLEFYNPKLVGTKTISVRVVDTRKGKRLSLVSNYTGAIEPFNLKGLIAHIKDFQM